MLIKTLFLNFLIEKLGLKQTETTPRGRYSAVYREVDPDMHSREPSDQRLSFEDERQWIGSSARAEAVEEAGLHPSPAELLMRKLFLKRPGDGWEREGRDGLESMIRAEGSGN